MKSKKRDRSIHDGSSNGSDDEWIERDPQQSCSYQIDLGSGNSHTNLDMKTHHRHRTKNSDLHHLQHHKCHLSSRYDRAT